MGYWIGREPLLDRFSTSWVAAACLLAGGCATLSGEEVQTVRVETIDRHGTGIAGADCRLANDKGSWSAKSPSLVEVRRSAEDLKVDCTAAGQEPGMARAVPRANGAIAGNLIFGGIPGAIVDSTTGAGYDYPDIVKVMFGAQLVVDTGSGAGIADPVPPVTAPTAPASLPASVALPRAGATWRYKVRDQQFRRDEHFTVRVTAVQNSLVTESIGADGAGSAAFVDALQLRFAERLVAGRSVLELSPYLLSRVAGKPIQLLEAPGDYPLGPLPERFRIRVLKAEPERVIVPAGVFNTLKVEVTGERSGTGSAMGSDRHWNTLLVARFRYTAWYAAETGRYVMARHQQWNPSGAPTGDDLIQLLEYGPK